MVKNAARGIIGKTIKAVVVKEGNAPPWQIFLVFDDDTSYEFYGNRAVSSASSLTGSLEWVRSYFEKTHKIIFEAVADDPGTKAADVN